MDVILRQTIDNLGRIGEIVTVKDGYARNYLIPHGFAYKASEGNKRRIETEKKHRLVQMAAEHADAGLLAEALEKAQAPMPIVYGHHDLLPANFIHDGSRLWLIDFEYAGFGTAMFDLAGVTSNAGFDQNQTEEFLTRYVGRIPDAALLQSHAAMQCASLLREAMWSMVSELHLNAPGVDYVAYTTENLERLGRSLVAYQTAYGKV